MIWPWGLLTGGLEAASVLLCSDLGLKRGGLDAAAARWRGPPQETAGNAGRRHNSPAFPTSRASTPSVALQPFFAADRPRIHGNHAGAPMPVKVVLILRVGVNATAAAPNHSHRMDGIARLDTKNYLRGITQCSLTSCSSAENGLHR